MCAAPEWKRLLLGLKHQPECQEFNCASALGSPQPACDLTGRVASPAPRGACRLSHPEQNRYTIRRAGGGKGRASQTRRFYNGLDLIRLVDHNLSSAKAQQRTQSRLFRASSEETARVNKAKPFHLQKESGEELAQPSVPHTSRGSRTHTGAFKAKLQFNPNHHPPQFTRRIRITE